MPKILTFLDLPDDDFMLALCVRSENLDDPSTWCAEMRAHAMAIQKGPKTVQEADELMEIAIRLADEAAGIRKQRG